MVESFYCHNKIPLSHFPLIQCHDVSFVHSRTLPEQRTIIEFTMRRIMHFEWRSTMTHTPIFMEIFISLCCWSFFFLSILVCRWKFKGVKMCHENLLWHSAAFFSFFVKLLRAFTAKSNCMNAHFHLSPKPLKLFIFFQKNLVFLMANLLHVMETTSMLGNIETEKQLAIAWIELVVRS